MPKNINIKQDKIKEEQSSDLTLIDENVDELILKKESLQIINKIITEADAEKQNDLTYLFNANQNKKTLVRINKLNDLLDAMTNQAVTRITKNPDEIATSELLSGLKIVQDLVERGQNQVVTQNETQPLIQINQQNNSVNLSDDSHEPSLSRDSRERVKNAVLGLLKGLDVTSTISNKSDEADIIDAELNDNEED